MFDEYIPDPPIQCPSCGKVLSGWQGKDGPNLLLVWKQRERFPIDCRLSDDMYADGKTPFLESISERLPDRFELYTNDCDCKRLVYAVGLCQDGIWTETELLSPQNAQPYPDENDRDFRKRVQELARLRREGNR